jgi:hypothetical protein
MIEALLFSLCLGLQEPEQEVPAVIDTPALWRGGAWLARLGGAVEDGGGKIDFEDNIDLRKKETVPLLEFSLEPTETLTMSLSFFDFSTSGNGLYVGNDVYGGVGFNNGNAWSGSTNMQSVGIETAWSVWEPYQAGNNATLSFAPVAGLRWFGIDTHLSNDTTVQEVTHENTWVTLQAGLEMEFRWDTRDTLNWADFVSIDAQLLVGAMLGNDGGSMASIQAGLGVDFTPNIGGFFGYRLQELNAEDGAYTFDAGLQGLFVGGEIRF